MRMLVVHNHYFERGGEDTVVGSETEMLKKFGHDVTLYERSNEEIEKLPLYAKLKLLLIDIIWSRQTYTEIKTLIKKVNPDIAHIHNIFFMVSPSVYYALEEERIPIVQTLHNYRLFCPKGIFYRDGRICEECNSRIFLPSLIHRCWRNSFVLTLSLSRILRFCHNQRIFQDKINAFIALSEFSKSKFIELGLPSDKIFVKSNFVDLRAEGEKRRASYALFIGRLVDYKGIKTLIAASEEFSNLPIKIIGDGPLYSELKARVSKIKNVELLGRLSYEKICGYLKNASFLVFPSECYENMPRVIIESFGCGVPVIASHLGAAAEFVKDGRNGIHFNTADSKDLASKMSWAWQNPKKMEEMGTQARREYEEKYTLEKNYESLMQIYTQAIKSGRN